MATIEDLRSVEGFGNKPGLCAQQARVWAQRHGLDWSAFLRDGVSTDWLEATGDAFALAVAAQARKRVEGAANG